MPRTSKEIFSENLRNKLFAKNKNQAQLAKFVGVPSEMNEDIDGIRYLISYR